MRGKKEGFAYDWSLIGIYLGLGFIGLVNLLSATPTVGGNEGLSWALNNPSANFVSQTYYFLVGFIFFIIISRFDYRYFERMAYPIYIFSLIGLVLVLFYAGEISGSRRWMSIGGFRFQPSEPGKLALIIIMAKYFSTQRRHQLYNLRELFVPLLLISIPLTLLYLEPDLGTGLFYFLIGFSVILFAGVKPKPLAFLAVFGVLVGFFAYRFLLHGYQQDRILTFFNPQRDPLGRGYHVIQSLIAVGSGKFLGKGYLAGSQSQLKFLPEQHTDFIFSVLAEEWGFVGCIFLLLLYFGLLTIGIKIATKARDRFAAFLAVGIVALFFWQILVNLGGVMGLLPITGITLPFLSYGGSSIITLSIAVGMLQNISSRRFMF